MTKTPPKMRSANRRSQAAKTNTGGSSEKSNVRLDSSYLRPSARRFPISDHIDSIMDTCPDEEHLATLLRLEHGYEAACDTLQEVTISDSVKRAIVIDCLARSSFDQSKLRDESGPELRNMAAAGRRECESHWRNKNFFASVDNIGASGPEYEEYRQAIATDLESNPISDDFADYLLIMSLAHGIEFSLKGFTAQDMARPILSALVKHFDD